MFLSLSAYSLFFTEVISPLRKLQTNALISTIKMSCCILDGEIQVATKDHSLKVILNQVLMIYQTGKMQERETDTREEGNLYILTCVPKF